MTAQASLRTMKIVVHAAPSSFSPRAIPTDREFVHETIQSFSGTASIHAYRHGPFGKYRRLVESLEVSNVVLEFGGEYPADCPRWSGAIAGDPPAKRTSILDTTRGRFGSPSSALELTGSYHP
ncbi:MAG: hypothetical protein NT138_04480 [Planctomycetales bacterium]|nr:hypothetical protein [Planctomycetales bacterium]